MKSFVAICLLFAVAVDSACVKNLLPPLISAPVITNVAVPGAAAPVVGVNPAAINLAAAYGLGPAFGVEPVLGLAPAGISFGVAPGVKFGARVPVVNVPYGAIAI